MFFKKISVLNIVDCREFSGASIKTNFKHFFVSATLSILKGFVFLKQNTGLIVKTTTRPLRPVGRFLFHFVGLPTYRLVFYFRRQVYRLYGPAKNKFLFLFANRYVFHATVVGIVVATCLVNIHVGEVRAESFGTNSLFFGLISQDNSEMVEEVSSGELQLVRLEQSSYLENFVVSSDDINFIFSDEQSPTVLGGSVVVAPTISELGESVASRGSVEEYVVQEGDVLGSIAEQFGLNLNTILWANDLTFRSTIRLNQKLIIPPTDGILYTVKKNDTISSIAKKYNTSSDKILSFNNLSENGTLKIGEALVLPDAKPPESAPVRYTAPASSIFTGSKSSASSAVATGSWVWPTDGGCRINAYFHQYYIYGLHQGLDIDGEYSSTIFAARGGVVSRASWWGAYGNAVEINHGDGYITRYGHLSKFFVSAGDVVNAGDALGMMGTTGKSTGVHLHLEVINGSTKMNPLNFIRCQ